MKKLLVLVSMAGVVAVLVAGLMGAFGTGDAPAVYASRLAGITGAGKTGIQVQNLDASQSASISAAFYNTRGGPPTEITLPPVAPGAAANMYLPDAQWNLQNGAYAAIISADRQIAAIARTEWESSLGAAIYSNVLPSTDVSVPLATKNFNGQTSIISIQNTDTNAQVSVTVRLFQTGQTAALRTQSFQIQPGTSITLDMNRDFPDVPAGFLGSARVTSDSTPIGVQTFIDFENSPRAVYAFEGVPSEMAATRLFAPLVRNNFDGTTGISIVNPNSNPVNVTVSFKGGAFGSCINQSYTQTGTIAAGSSAVFYQGGNVPGIGPNPLPDRCLASAEINSEGGGILAIVNDAKLAGSTADTSGAYNAVSMETAALKVALPLYRHKWTRDGQLTTGIQAMNVGTAPANVEISFNASEFSAGGGGEVTCGGGACQKTIQPGGSYTWYPPSPDLSGSVVASSFGSATIESNQPLAVIVNDVSEGTATKKFDSAIYNGIKADVQ